MSVKSQIYETQGKTENFPKLREAKETWQLKAAHYS